MAFADRMPVVARAPQQETHAIHLRGVTKTYETEAGPFTALRGIDLGINAGELVGIIGKSGSGKSTLINMITGIDRPTSGEIVVAGTTVHTLDEGQAAVWRGKDVGIVFQFFQLLPTLSLLQNVMLPMDFRGTYPRAERHKRGMELLERVGLAAQAHKLPAAVSGGQQQRAAIARALANDPPIVIADEPTGNLDSSTADSIFELFKELARDGKTVVMVTHDNDLARRVDRVMIVVDGQIVSQYVALALATLDLDELSQTVAHLKQITFPPGSPIVRQGDAPDYFYIVTSGEAEILLEHPGGQQILVNTLHPGQYFGEMALLQDTRRMATVRASDAGPVEVMALDAPTFQTVMDTSDSTRETIARTMDERLAQDDVFG